MFSNAVLGDQAKAVGMLKAGEIDVAEFNSAPLSEAAPGLKAFNLPFLFSDSAHMFRHLDGQVGGRLAEKLRASGYVVLGWYNGGGRSFFCANKLMTREMSPLYKKYLADPDVRGELFSIISDNK